MTESGPNGGIALCIPAYNAERFLPRLFASMAAQTQPFDEVWLYDDASTDHTSAMAEQLGARVVRGERNLGCSAGKNELLKRIDSPWVHFHDADDILHPEFVARAKQRISKDETRVLIFDYEQVDEASGHLISRSEFGASALFQNPLVYLLRETVNNGGAYRKSFLRTVGGFDDDPAVSFNEDRAFHLRLVEAGARFAHEPYLACRFYFNSESMSAANQLKCTLANQEITQRFAERNPDAYSREISDQSWKNAGILASYLQWAAADEAMGLATERGGRIPAEGSLLFKTLCAIHGRTSRSIRERLIRWLKPRYRLGYPT